MIRGNTVSGNRCDVLLLSSEEITSSARNKLGLGINYSSVQLTIVMMSDSIQHK